MKLRIDKKSNTVELELPIKGGAEKMVTLPTENIKYWYPFNINHFYRYTESKDMMYLSKDTSYKGENIYGIDILKKTKPLQYVTDVPYHPFVYKRNTYIIMKAEQLGIPTIDDDFDIVDVEKGFKDIGAMITTLENIIADRTEVSVGPNVGYTIPEWESLLKEHTTDKETILYEELGEIYAMLTIMRKLTERE